MTEVANIFVKRGIPFDSVKQRIRQVLHVSIFFFYHYIFHRCFPHIVNLACKAVLSAITNLDYAKEPTTPEEQTSSLNEVAGDPIATIRALIRVVCYTL